MGIAPRSSGIGAGLDRAMLGAVILAGLGVTLLIVALPILLSSQGWAYDFSTYFTAALRTRSGLTPYLPVNLAGPFVQGPQWYVYAPVLSTLVIPLTALTLEQASIVWLGLSVALTCVACGLMPVRPTIRVAVLGVTFLSLGWLSDVNLGSVNAVLLFAVVLAWRWPERPATGIVLALSLSIRPYLVTVVVGWALWRRWRAVAWTIVGGIILIIGTALVAGPGAFVDFLRLLGNVRFAGAPHNGGAVGVADALGFSGTVLSIVTAAAIVVALGAIAVARRRSDAELTFIVAVGASILASPVIWDHYLMLLAIQAAWLAQRGRTWGLVLPLLSWLPWPLYPVVALVATCAPFLARSAGNLSEPIELVSTNALLTQAGPVDASRSANLTP